MSTYLEFKEVLFKGKTKRFDIISKSSGDLLARIQWYPQWRQYVFLPAYPTRWNKDCLNDIEKFIENLMAERKWKELGKICFDDKGICLDCGTRGELATGIGYFCPNKKCKN